MEIKSWEEIRAAKARPRPYSPEHKSELPGDFDPLAPPGQYSVEKGSDLDPVSKSPLEEINKKLERMNRIHRYVQLTRAVVLTICVLAAMYLTATQK